MAEEKEYTHEEVARHNHEKDLWMIIHGHVYDLTKFLKEHPGGEEVLLNSAGEDGTKCFDDIGHSQEALQLRDSLRLGRVVGDPLPTNAQTSGTSPTIDDDDWQYEEPKSQGSGMLSLFAALGVVIYGIVFYYMFWKQ